MSDKPYPPGTAVQAHQYVDTSSDWQPPTAGELREAGYVIADEAVADDQVPSMYYASTPTATGIYHHVDQPSPVYPSAQTAEEASEAADHESQGRLAAQAGERRDANPYDGRTSEGRAWLRGWDAGHE